MEPFVHFQATGVPIDIANCDTDQIIPARFLRFLPEDGGFERYLLHDLRYDENGAERPDFIFNREPYRQGRIFVADVNWGCGSSRENAVYALVANHIRAVIAPSFGDIHYNNCMKHGVLPVVLPRPTCDAMRAALHATPGAELSIDLEAQTVTEADGQIHGFEIGDFDKQKMLKGLDDIGITLEYDDEFERFETKHRAAYDWLPAD